MNEGLLSFIEDPTLVAQRQILANLGGGSMMPAQMQMQMPMQAQAQSGLLGSGLLGSGLINTAPSMTGGAPLIQDYRLLANRFRAESDARAAGMAATGAGGGGGYDGGMDNSAWSQMSPAEQAAYYAENPTMGSITRAGQTAFGYAFPGFAAAQEYMSPGFAADQRTIASGYDPTNSDPFSADSVASDLSRAGYSDLGGYNDSAPDMSGFDTGGGDSGGGKIVCTAMNHAYGFGGFRNKIWLAYAAKHLTKAHEVGYHALFLPLVAVGYNQGDKMHNRIVRRVLENIARHRSADLRAEMRGTKRDPVGRAYRLILEPLCFAVGKLKGY
jgi:hypothetical protein